MEKLYKLVKELENNIDNEENTIKLLEGYNNIKNNNTLINKIKEYNINHDEYLRLDIINNKDYREIKHLEGVLNYQILEINNELNEITNKRSCQ